jgi:hypothetical protein
MNRSELVKTLQAEGISPDSYDLDGGHPNERYVLSGNDTSWPVYYSERGLESGWRPFASEETACEYLLKLLREDPTTKRTK